MRVIHDDQEWLTLVDAFEPAGDCAARCESAFDYLRVDPETIGRAPRCQEVVDIDFTDERRLHRVSPAAVVNLKAEPVKIRCDALSPRRSSFSQAIRDH